MTKSSPVDALVLATLLQNQTSVRSENGKFGACLVVDNEHAKARISLFGGHLLSYIPKKDQRERLWLSKCAIFDAMTPIRGGVPICWPWFGASKNFANAPNHGFVRTQMWQLVAIENQSTANPHQMSTVCTLVPTRLGAYGIPAELTVILRISIGVACEIQLITENQSERSVPLSQAIHSYFAVTDIANVAIEGINAPYFNKLDKSVGNESSSPYLIGAETDSVHGLDPSIAGSVYQTIAITEASRTTVHIEHSGHNGTVVWNPWVGKSQSMSDICDGGYVSMLCIEAVTEPEIILKLGQRHVLTQRFY